MSKFTKNRSKKKISLTLVASALGGGITIAAVAQACGGGGQSEPEPNPDPVLTEEQVITSTIMELQNFSQGTSISTNASVLLSLIESGIESVNSVTVINLRSITIAPLTGSLVDTISFQINGDGTYTTTLTNVNMTVETQITEDSATVNAEYNNDNSRVDVEQRNDVVFSNLIVRRLGVTNYEILTSNSSNTTGLTVSQSAISRTLADAMQSLANYNSSNPPTNQTALDLISQMESTLFAPNSILGIRFDASTVVASFSDQTDRGQIRVLGNIQIYLFVNGSYQVFTAEYSEANNNTSSPFELINIVITAIRINSLSIMNLTQSTEVQDEVNILNDVLNASSRPMETFQATIWDGIETAIRANESDPTGIINNISIANSNLIDIISFSPTPGTSVPFSRISVSADNNAVEIDYTNNALNFTEVLTNTSPIFIDFGFASSRVSSVAVVTTDVTFSDLQAGAVISTLNGAISSFIPNAPDVIAIQPLTNLLLQQVNQTPVAPQLSETGAGQVAYDAQPFNQISAIQADTISDAVIVSGQTNVYRVTIDTLEFVATSTVYEMLTSNFNIQNSSNTPVGFFVDLAVTFDGTNRVTINSATVTNGFEQNVVTTFGPNPSIGDPAQNLENVYDLFFAFQLQVTENSESRFRNVANNQVVQLNTADRDGTFDYQIISAVSFISAVTRLISNTPSTIDSFTFGTFDAADIRLSLRAPGALALISAFTFNNSTQDGTVSFNPRFFTLGPSLVGNWTGELNGQTVDFPFIQPLTLSYRVIVNALGFRTLIFRETVS